MSELSSPPITLAVLGLADQKRRSRFLSQRYDDEWLRITVVYRFFLFIQQNDRDMAQMLWLVIDLQMDLYYHSLSLFVRASSSVVVACPLLLGWIGW